MHGVHFSKTMMRLLHFYGIAGLDHRRLPIFVRVPTVAVSRYFTLRSIGCATVSPFTMSRARSTCALVRQRRAKRAVTISGGYNSAIGKLISRAGHAGNAKAAMLATEKATTTAASHRRQSRGGSPRTKFTCYPVDPL